MVKSFDDEFWDNCLNDVARIRTVVESLRPGEILLADANTGWRRNEELRVAAAIVDLDYYLEQPCLRYDDCLAVRRAAVQPFKLDETLQEDARTGRNSTTKRSRIAL